MLYNKHDIIVYKANPCPTELDTNKDLRHWPHASYIKINSLIYYSYL